ncbi:MAG: hypothetical protein RMM58_03565, partial [Chloroflexota bacterium]|nr:hypothetical protein [Chloroflexota bacterium]
WNVANVVQFAGGRFIAGGDAQGSPSAPVLLTSSDGAQWSAASLTLPSSIDRSTLQVHHLAFGNNRYVALGYSGYTPVVLTSSDGTNWTGRVLEEVGSFTLHSLVFGNGRFLAASNTQVWTSPDGTTWTEHAVAGLGWNYLQRVVFANGRFVGALNTGAIATSTDGITWSVGPTVCSSGGPRLYVLGDTVVGICGTEAFTSNDGGSSWSALPGFPGYQIAAIAGTSGRWVALSQAGSILTYTP